MTLAIEPVDDRDLAYAESLLEAAGLPTAGLRDASVSLYVAVEGDDRRGIGGVERYGGHGVLRSIVIEPETRGEGHGSRLVDAIEVEARAAGIDTLALLTTDAAPFFRRLGYEPAEWADQPAGVRDASALTRACPSSATCLEKRL